MTDDFLSDGWTINEGAKMRTDPSQRHDNEGADPKQRTTEAKEVPRVQMPDSLETVF